MSDVPSRITVDSEILGGKPAVRGTRIPVSLILELLAAGKSEDDVLQEYPTLKREDIRASLDYASRILRDEEIIPIET